ncbi:hypothetical protein J6590_001786, partial [Homalodisca vitripennis]
ADATATVRCSLVILPMFSERLVETNECKECPNEKIHQHAADVRRLFYKTTTSHILSPLTIRKQRISSAFQSIHFLNS